MAIELDAEIEEWRDHCKADKPAKYNKDAQASVGANGQIIRQAHLAFGWPYRKALRSFLAGRERRVELAWDPGNEHDKDALAVLGHWTSRNGEEHEDGELGYLKRADRDWIRTKLAEGMPLRAVWVAGWVNSDDEDADLVVLIVKDETTGTSTLRKIGVASSGGCLLPAAVIALSGAALLYLLV